MGFVQDELERIPQAEALIIGGYFQAWRRKTGLVMLVLACVLSSGWVRSFQCEDLIRIPTGKTTEHIFGSSGGFLFLARSIVNNPQYTPKFSYQFGSKPDLFWPLLYEKATVRWHWTGCAELDFYTLGEAKWIFPYGLAVLPLALFSLYFLFVQPRKARIATTN